MNTLILKRLGKYGALFLTSYLFGIGLFALMFGI